MNTPDSDLISTSIHEIGHALVACALDLEFDKVAIWQDQQNRWVGKCYLANNKTLLPEAAIETFNLGGPLVQLILAPESLGTCLSRFQPSIFSSCETIEDDGDEINDLFWYNDFWKCHFLLHARDIVKKNKPERPHLFELEKHLRDFFLQPATQQFVKDLANSLAHTKSLDAKEIKEQFLKFIPANSYSTLNKFVKSIPERCLSVTPSNQSRTSCAKTSVSTATPNAFPSSPGCST